MFDRLGVGVLAVALASCAGPGEGLPAVEDGGPVYRSLNGRFPKIPACIDDAFEGRKTDPAEVDAALASVGPLLDELARATRAIRCTWTYDRPPSIADEYPLDFVFNAAKPLVIRGRRRIRSGAVGAGLEDLAVLSKFGSDLSQDRWLIGHLLGLICQYWACDELRTWIRSGPLETSRLREMDEHLRLLLGRFPTFNARLRHEKEMSLSLLEGIRDLGVDEVVRRVAKDKSEPKEPHPIMTLWEEWLRKTLSKDLDRVRETVSRRWDVLLAPFEQEVRLPLNSQRLAEKVAEVKAGGRELSRRMARTALGAGAGEEQATMDLADLLFRLWFPSSEKAVENHAKVRLVLEMTALSCRLELHRTTFGRYPENLKEAGKNPSDPYDGTVLRYRRIATPEGEGYVLAGAGPKNDAETRIRVLAEECKFDPDLFEKKGYENAEFYTFGVFRRR